MGANQTGLCPQKRRGPGRGKQGAQGERPRDKRPGTGLPAWELSAHGLRGGPPGAVLGSRQPAHAGRHAEKPPAIAPLRRAPLPRVICNRSADEHSSTQRSPRGVHQVPPGGHQTLHPSASRGHMCPRGKRLPAESGAEAGDHVQAARLIMRNEAPGLGEGLEGLGGRCPGREPAHCPSCPLPAGWCL